VSWKNVSLMPAIQPDSFSIKRPRILSMGLP
jgi:hypothetical protein